MSAHPFIKTIKELSEKANGTDAESYSALIKLRFFLFDNRQQLIDLVKAAEEVVEWSEVTSSDDDFIVRLGSALAALKDKT